VARPIKKGLDYFPLDVHEDSKTEALIRKYGLVGYGLLITLYKEIYKEGYYVKIEGDFIEDLCLKMDIEEADFSNILSFMVKRSFFNYDLFNNEKVLTSNGIQKRYFEAIKRRKNPDQLEFMLLDVNNNVVNVSNNSVNDDISTQRKEKESKVKEIKEKINVCEWLNDELFYAFLDIRKELGIKESLASKSVALILNELKENSSFANSALKKAIKQNSKSLTWAINESKKDNNQSQGNYRP
tara:strand:- start:39 stop:761 length:723 start_codon:yes stop_codon:yes gene_type:complete